MKSMLLAGAAIALVVVSGAAQATIIDFEEIGVPNSVFPYYTQQGFTSQGYLFSTNSDVVDIGPTAPWSDNGPARSGRYAALNDFGGSIVMTKAGGGTFSLVGFHVKIWDNVVGPQTAKAFRNSVEVASVGYAPGGTWTLVDTGFREVDAVQFNGTNGYVLIDDVRIGTGAVPEPAAWAMLIAGFGLVGAAMRRRHVAAAA